MSRPVSAARVRPPSPSVMAGFGPASRPVSAVTAGSSLRSIGTASVATAGPAGLSQPLFRPSSAASVRTAPAGATMPSVALATGSARPSSPLFATQRSVSTLGMSRATTPALYVAVRERAAEIGERFEEPKAAPPLDRTASKPTHPEHCTFV